MHLFYTPLLTPEMDAFLLDEAESKHAVRVLRLAEGDRVQLVDGEGGLYEGVIEDAHPKRVALTIRSREENFHPLPYRLHIAVAPTKSMDRLEWFIEKATEIGLTEITPLICDRSERKDVKVERLEKVAIAAMKQSLKAFLPKIHEPQRFSTFIREATGDATKRFIAHCADGEKSFLQDSISSGDSILVLIGPEGDFSPTEIAQAQEAGYLPITLGNARLRTETAALAACFEVSLFHRS